MDYSPVLLPFASAAFVSFALAAYALRRRRPEHSDWTVRGLVALLAGAGWWATTYTFRLASTGIESKLFWVVAEYAFTGLVPIGWLVIAVAYAGYDNWITRRRVLALAIFPAATFVLVATNQSHHLMWADPELTTFGGVAVIERTWGPWFPVHVAYAYALLLVGFALFGWRALSAEGPYRRQALALFGAAVIPFLANVVYVFDVGVFSYVELSSAGFTVSGAVFVLAIYRYRLLDLTPIGYSVAVESVNDHYVVLDRERRVVEMNPSARETFGVAEPFMGRLAERALPFDVASLTEDAREEPTRHRLTHDGGDGTRYFDTLVAPIRTGELRGWTLVFRDVTERHEYERALELQNERLEEFAGVVSHDLRNPLAVAKGNVELLAEHVDGGDGDIGGDGPHERIQTVRRALDRMDDIVDDTLTLVREGNPDVDTERISLERAARGAWETVDTGAATLRVREDATVSADPGRLQTLFENLFRNAVEHGSTGQSADVTVTVGTLSDGRGFYVADDGPGIPPEQREDVLEIGYSTGADGTGFGLHIVQRVAEAHGWTVTVTEGDSGGARFEFSPVDVER